MIDNEVLLLQYIQKRLDDGPYLVKNNLMENGSIIEKRETFEELKSNIDAFLEGNSHNRFVFMPGLRGVGKTILLFQIYDYLLKKGVDENRILYFSADNLNQLLNSNIRDVIEVFCEEIHENSLEKLNKELFVFIDEAQEIEGWSKQGKVIYDSSKKIFMIFTGSVALDFEIDVNAVRRTKKEMIFPLNFKEYLLLKYKIKSINPLSNMLVDTIMTGNLNDIAKTEKEIYFSLPDMELSFNKEWKHYMVHGSFPESIFLNESEAHKRIFSMIERVVEKDVYHYLSYNNGTRDKIFRMLTFIALQKPGPLSKDNLANSINLSSSQVYNIMNILEKTHLIFHLNPYGGAGKTVRKAWKYYFTSPNLNAAINAELGRYNPQDNNYMGILAETLVASTFFRMKTLLNKPNGIFYPSDKKQADFLIKKIDDSLIPVEVGFGKKSDKQVKRSMNKFDCEYGIVVSDTTPFIKKEEDIIYIPLTTFSHI